MSNFCATSLVDRPRPRPLQHFALALGQRLQARAGEDRSPRSSSAIVLLDRRAEVRAAGHDHGVDGGHQVLHGGVLQQVGVGAALHRPRHVLPPGVHRQHDHLQRGKAAFTSSQHVDAVAPGMFRSSTSTSASVRAHHLEGRVAVGDFGHHDDAGLALEDAADAAAHQRVVVGQQHADRGGVTAAPDGQHRLDAHAARRRRLISSEPPTEVTRSRMPSQPRCGRRLRRRALSVVLDHEDDAVGVDPPG